MFLSKTFKPLATPEANQKQSDHWLNKAATYENEGKSAAICRLALNKALDFETAARQ